MIHRDPEPASSRESPCALEHATFEPRKLVLREYYEAMAILRIVQTEPENRTARLVFADWLQDHDEEPFARFIRDHVAIRILRPDFHPERWSVRLDLRFVPDGAALLDSMRLALDEHRDAWTDLLLPGFSRAVPDGELVFWDAFPARARAPKSWLLPQGVSLHLLGCSLGEPVDAELLCDAGATVDRLLGRVVDPTIHFKSSGVFRPASIGVLEAVMPERVDASSIDRMRAFAEAIARIFDGNQMGLIGLSHVLVPACEAVGKKLSPEGLEQMNAAAAEYCTVTLGRSRSGEEFTERARSVTGELRALPRGTSFEEVRGYLRDAALRRAP